MYEQGGEANSAIKGCSFGLHIHGSKGSGKAIGYEEFNKGRTSGSRVLLYRVADGRKILLHKPHPGDIMRKYAVKDLYETLKRNGDII